MGKKMQAPENMEKQKKREQFIAGFLMEFPKSTHSKVSMEWKRRGNRTQVPKDEYQIAKNHVEAHWEGKVLADSWYGLRNLEKAKERRLRREAQAQEASALAEKYPIGRTVAGTELKKLFDEHFADVLGASLKLTSGKGNSQKFRIAKRLPTQSEYETRRSEHFRLTVADLLSLVSEIISVGATSLSERLDEMSDRAREGGRGTDIGEALELLESVVHDLEESQIPESIRHLNVCWLPQVSSRRSPKRIEVSVTQIEFLRTQIETRFVNSVVDAAALIEHSFSTKAAKELTSSLKESPEILLDFAQRLGESVEGINEAIDLSRSSLP
ncbi:hypothetical protein SH528x_007298 [Novipirellula sp. SH528]|uniref:hypothetical protein n=1 Tax=Novipirellula sp. SH528 TaxID=3454466 RepID=UPI003FA076FC